MVMTGHAGLTSCCLNQAMAIRVNRVWVGLPKMHVKTPAWSRRLVQKLPPGDKSQGADDIYSFMKVNEISTESEPRTDQRQGDYLKKTKNRLKSSRKLRVPDVVLEFVPL
jgi:hypothetical protein